MEDSPKAMEAGLKPDPNYDDLKATQEEIIVSHNIETQRGLSSRHIQFLALGGCIGTGLFVGSGAALSTVGPGKLYSIDVGRILTQIESTSSYGLHCHVECGLFHHEHAG